MDKPATVSDIARAAGCTPTTVSRYLNKSGYVSEKTAKKIKAAIESLHYKPNILARSLRNRVNKTIFMAVPDIENPFHAKLYKVVQDLATARGFFIMVYNTGSEEAEERRVLSYAAGMNVCGIIFFSNNFTEDLLCRLDKLKIPTVVNYYRACQFDSVHGKENESSYSATRYLIEKGHRNIGFVGGNDSSIIEGSRRNGYLRALEDSGLAFEPRNMVEIGFTIEAGKKAGEYFSTVSPYPTAICCGNDLVALGLIAWLGEHDVRVPEQVSVIGIDNIIYDEISAPQITSVTSDPEDFAAKAFGMLMDRIEGDYDGPPRDAVIAHRIVERNSIKEL